MTRPMPAGGAGDKCGFTGDVEHNRLRCRLKGLHTHRDQGSASEKECRDVTDEQFGILVVRAVRGVWINCAFGRSC